MSHKIFHLAEVALNSVEDLRLIAADTGVPMTWDDALHRMWDRLDPAFKPAFDGVDDFKTTAAPLMKSVAENVYGVMQHDDF